MNSRRSSSLARRLVGLVLLALVVLPAHRLLRAERAGPAALSTVAIADADASVVLLGTFVLVALGAVLAWTLGSAPVNRLTTSLHALVTRSSTHAWAWGLAGLSLLLGCASAYGLHGTKPRLLDEMSQLLHARVFAAGHLTLPLPEPQAARLIQNSVVVPEGWVSVYPPGHTALLAGGMELGAPWLVGPLLLALSSALLFLTLTRLYPHRPGTARLAGLAAAGSPFLVFLGSGYLSHVSAAAAAALAFYGAVRAWDGNAFWGVLSGAAVGLMVTSRPWIGLTLGAFLTVGLWGTAWYREGRPLPWLSRRGGALLLGGAPFAIALFAYNRFLFGSPFRLGYDVAFGPAHGLGFHADPWGNVYGLREALGYTGADLVTLGLRLFETPVPAVGLVGLFLVLVPRTSMATRLLTGWAIVPLLANAFYWHHGQHLGPRMLFEAAPAWAALTVIAVVGLVEGARDPGLSDVSPGGRRTGALPRVLFWTVALALPLGATMLVPARIASLRRSPEELAAVSPPILPSGGVGDLVFVHGAWPNRVASKLAALGMRRDSVESALRRNDLCRVQFYAEERGVGGPIDSTIDMQPLAGTPSRLRMVEIVPGLVVRLEDGGLPPRCARELNADTLGVVELAPLLWMTALPGQSQTEGAPLLYRDMGPALNSAVAALHPERTRWVWTPATPGSLPELRPYQQAMAELWGGVER